ncbi:NADPH-dependent ferric siderophore reductase [Haloactinospora alba]|uniref:NADPH-dependent ferric siderophore reductase n=1 Tax=Haloactinospora alba TaxID=405555 RepID=A0A543NH61_9ACTN|nr:siderophore-interacting protein [Haloactinospora alba]TQN31188.1 NADPH-dependent ferric siderophore reductase [Haloactinospora alba]
MSTQPASRKRTLNRGRVRRVEHLSPHMVRLVLGGDGLSAFEAGEYTDHYIKLLFPQPGVAYPEPFDMDAVRRDMPRAQWPATRTYTVRFWDPQARELTIDVVYHGDMGLAGPWAAAAQPGDEIYFLGPGGAYAPDPAADWHLLAGDESALPAIAASAERLPSGTPAHVVVEVSGPAEEQEIPAPASATVQWVHRENRRVGEALVETVRSLALPEGRGQAFVHGEAGAVKDLRRFLRFERDMSRDQLSASGYWKLGNDEDGWQAAKTEWNREVEREEEGLAASPTH